MTRRKNIIPGKLFSYCLCLFTACCLLFTVSTLSAMAAEPGAKLTLTAAIKNALENNYEIRAFKNSLAAVNENVGVSRSSLLPQLNFEERFMRTNNPTYVFMARLNQERFAQGDFAISTLNNPEAINDFQTSLSLEQTLFNRKAYVGLKMAKLELTAKNNDYLRKKEEIAFNVTRAYFTVMTARELVGFSEKTLEDTREHFRIAEKRYNSGLGLSSDTLRASTAVSEASQKLVSAKKNLAIAKMALSLLMGISGTVDVAEDRPEIIVKDLEYYKNSAISRNDIKSMESLRENAENSISLSEAAYWPTLGMGGSYQLNDYRYPIGSEGSSWTLTALLRWELFNGAKREHELAQARYRTAEAGELLKGLRDNVMFKVYASYLNNEEAGKNVELSREELKTAEEGKRQVKVRYENSLSPLVDLLDAQVNLDHARVNLVDKENEYRISSANLGYESGTILKDLNIE